MSKSLKYLDTLIGFREVPDEVSLLINITNCPYQCIGCHSPQLQEDIGSALNIEALDKLLPEVEETPITCVVFLGDGGNIEALGTLIEYIHNKGLLTCLYTGSTSVCQAITSSNKTLDYIKVGGYLQEMGPLDKVGTNQRFYRIHYLQLPNGVNNGWLLEDLTYKFQNNENKN